ncbi:MAG: peptide chain release factor 1 [Firmicutes bacterium ZCTH02-B6]|nr:MAG: peptide chain release factor 1 [Firmicutes bacterium ZCTH02-B6]
MFDKLAELEQRYLELEQRLGDPEVLHDPVQLQKVAKAHADLQEIVSCYREYNRVQAEMQATRAMLEEKLEPELREMAKEELARLEQREDELKQQLRRLLLPKDPNDEKNIIMEIRAGAGGEEAALFAADLFRMYSRYAENRGWRVEMMSANPTELGGFKEVVFMIHGKNAYSRLKYESGVHRVQRVPTTEASGRIHTSTATVAVLPEAEEVDVEVRPEDLRIDVFRSGGHGGQSVNTTDSAIRITHLPTGLVVTCQDERSQLQNKEKALRVLRARLLDMKRREQEEQMAQARRSQVGTGERSERIRTYNFPQGRMTDHRIGLTLYRLDAVLEGDLDEIIDALILADQTEQLQRQEAEV